MKGNKGMIEVMKYKKIKTFEYEAVRLTRDNFLEVADWARVESYWGLEAPTPALHLQNDDGNQVGHAYLGHWVIRDYRGKFYSRNDLVFTACYEVLPTAQEG